MFLQNQIKNLMNTNRQNDRKTNDSQYNDEDDSRKELEYKDFKPSKPNKSQHEPPKRNEIKSKGSVTNLEKAYLATDRIYQRETQIEPEKSFITTDRNQLIHNKNASFHNDANKDLNKNKMRMNEENIKVNKHLLMEKNQNDTRNINVSSTTQLKNCAINNKNYNKNETEEDLNSKYFLKANRNKSPIKQDYRNYECNADKKRDLSAINKTISEVYY